MKVLILNQIPEVNNKYTFSLARALEMQGVDVTVCGISTDNVAEYSDVKYINIFESYSIVHSLIGKVASYYNSWKHVYQYSIENKIEIVHTQWNIFSPVDCVFHKKLQKHGIKVIVTIHDLLPFNTKFYDHYYHKKIYSTADAVISQARMNKDRLLHEFDVADNKIHYIPHGHYMEFSESIDKIESRKKINLPLDRPIVLFFGQIKKVKGVGILIEAIEIAKKTVPDIYCLIAGKVWKDDFEQYTQEIQTLRLESNIRTDITYIPDDEVKYYFCSADVVALPYLQVYQSGVVLLAYAYEKPVVATRTGEFESVVHDSETGILVEPGNARELAQGIIKYLENPDLANAQAKKGKEDLNVRLSWETIARRIKKVYGGLLRR